MLKKTSMRYLYLLAIILCSAIKADSQTPTKITHFGTSTISGNTISVTSTQTTNSYIGCPPINPYWIGSTGYADNYKYTFYIELPKICKDDIIVLP